MKFKGLDKADSFWCLAPTHQPSKIIMFGAFFTFVHFDFILLSSIDLSNLGIKILLKIFF